MKAASHLFICVSGEQPEAGQPEEAPFLTLADRTDSGECACVRDSRVSDARRRLPSPHQTHVVLVGGDLLVVRGAGQRPPGRDATAGGLGGAVVT